MIRCIVTRSYDKHQSYTIRIFLSKSLKLSLGAIPTKDANPSFL